MNKKDLRRSMIEQRDNLSSNQYQAYNEAIFIQLMSMDQLRDADKIFTYISIGNEVNTHRIIEWGQQQGKTIYVPKITGHREMSFSRFVSLDMCTMNPWHIPEPIQDAFDLPTEHSVFLVPLLLTNSAGQRIGYGGGFYDTYFQKHNQLGYKIGLAYSFQMIHEVLPIEAFDVNMDYIVSDKGLYQIKE